MARKAEIQVPGLRALARESRQAAPLVYQALRGGIRDIVGLMAEQSRPRTPFHEKKQPHRHYKDQLRWPPQHRHLRDATRGQVTTGAKGRVVNTLPYANVIEWGGGLPSKETQTSKTPGTTRIQPHRFLSKTFEEHVAEYELLLDRRITESLARVGWRP